MEIGAKVKVEVEDDDIVEFESYCYYNGLKEEDNEFKTEEEDNEFITEEEDNEFKTEEEEKLDVDEDETIAEFHPSQSVNDLKKYFAQGSKVASITSIDGEKEPSETEQDLLNFIRNNPGQYSCKICGSPFDKQSTLTNHMKTHKTEKDMGLDLSCEYVLTAKDYMIPETYPKRLYDSRDSKKKLYTPVKLLPPNYAFTCEICTTPFAYKVTLAKHMRKIHRLNLTRRYFCTGCKRDLASKQSLLGHVSKCIPKKSVDYSVIKTKGANGSDEWFFMYT